MSPITCYTPKIHGGWQEGGEAETETPPTLWSHSNTEMQINDCQIKMFITGDGDIHTVIVHKGRQNQQEKSLW